MQLHQIYEEIVKTNTRVLAISVDGKENANVMIEKTGIQFDILCDEALEVIRMYNLEDDDKMVWDFIDGKSRKVKTPRSISLSANVLINQQGTIISQWQGHYNYRPHPELTIASLKNM